MMAGAASLLVGTQLGCRNQPWYNHMTPEFARRRDSDMAAVATPFDDVFEQCRDMDASLTERLAIFAAAVRSRQPSFTAAVDRLVKRLHESGAGDAAPRAGRRDAAVCIAGRNRPTRKPRSNAAGGTGRGHLSSRALVPLLPDQHQCFGKSAREIPPKAARSSPSSRSGSNTRRNSRPTGTRRSQF